MAETASGRAQESRARPKHLSIPSKWLYLDDSRFDATTYAEEGYAALRALEACPFPKVALGEIVGRVYHPTESQPRSNFKRIWVKRGEGPPFLTGRQLFFFRPDREKFVSPRMRKLHELLVPERTILLSRSGTTGYPVLVGKWLSGFAVTDDAIRIFPGTAPTGFVYAFLASSIARALMVKHEYGATVSHLEAKHISSLPTPVLPDAAQRSVDERVAKAYALRDQANGILDKAEAELHEALGVSPFADDDVEYLAGEGLARAFSISSVDLGERFDATHHVPVARSATHKLEAGRYRLVRLDERVERVYVAPRFARVYVDEEFGTPLLQGSQLPAITPHGLKYISNTMTQNIDRWIIRSGWVLVTCSGTIGRIAVATKGQDKWAASQHILRVIPKEHVSHSGFLAAFVSTPYGQHQLKAKIYGGVVDELTAEDTSAVLIPDVPFKEQERIGTPVVQAYEMRDMANAIEEEAVREVEEWIRRPESIGKIVRLTPRGGEPAK